MIEPVHGDLLAADAEALVNAVNCVGVMGGGLAAQFKAAFPENFHAYAAACARGEVRLGRMHVFETGYPRNPRFLVNFPTLHHWSDGSRLSDVEHGLAALADEIRSRAIRSIAVP
ncbi:MAG: macro domain-containing protein, partial [Rhodospirillaceae bacterium]